MKKETIYDETITNLLLMQGQCKPNAIEFTRNSCLGKRLLRRRAAEVQPVLVFEDKDREFLDQFQEIAPILLQLVWTNAPTLDKSQKSIQNLSKRADK